MTIDFKNNDTKSAFEAQYAAQKIAFAPIVFQAARVMRDTGILENLHQHRKEGLLAEDLEKITSLSHYGIKLLLETGLSADIVKIQGDRYFLTKTGYFLFNDEMTRINMDYSHYVNFQALFFLEESIREARPLGLKNFGPWETIYPGLTSLPEKTRDSWFNFDHYYSDSAFPQAYQELLAHGAKRILDVGGNTGKFSIFAAKQENQIQLCILDIAQQIAIAQENIEKEGVSAKVNTLVNDVLEEPEPFPGGYDIIWMSQFLDCFSETEITAILKKAHAAMDDHAQLWIMEPLWDRQKFETSAFCIINTSPYFTIMANGKSKMLHSSDLINCINNAGLNILNIVDNVGICQSIIKCAAKA
jgi:SAM-dependent methyltransferase